jgi:amino acid adenylation domain-containing protein
MRQHVASLLHSRASSLDAAGGRPCGTRIDQRWARQFCSIPDRVRALASHFPERQALFDPLTSFAYGDLDRQVDLMARGIVAEAGADPEPVLLATGVDARAVIAALAIMRAGKYFVGIEPTLPATRVSQIAEDCAARLVVADRACLPDLATAFAGCRILDLSVAADRDSGSALPSMTADSIALLNYTSGSTGAPKGVVYTHRAAMSQVVRYADSFLLGDADRHVGFGSLAWSGACWDAFGALCVGAAAGVYDLRRHGMHALPDWLAGSGATVLSGMMIVRTIGREFPGCRLPAVRLVQLGGDTVYRLDVETCQRLFPDAVAAVGYGITEAGRVAQHFIAPGSGSCQDVLPLGFPLPGVRVLILNDDGSEAAPGAIGEIAVQADDLASGYLGSAALTSARFRNDLPYGARRVYLTGDLGRTLQDGSLQNAGRRDFQMKIRGHRVSAGEVEAALLKQPGVREACVVVQGSPALDEKLVAFVVRDGVPASAGEDLTRQLRGVLPDHMVPRRIVDLSTMPRTPTGKIDRRALQATPVAAQSARAGGPAPRTPTEVRVAAIWDDVLGTAVGGVDDDFLSLGGDSLQAMQIVSRIRRDFGLEIPLGMLLSQQTVAQMAAAIALQSVPPASAVTEPGDAGAPPSSGRRQVNVGARHRNP